jgi:RimJ/RimL family protein N-acetyltransferase
MKNLLETDRLLLRRFCAEDLSGLMTVLGDPEVMRFSVSGALDEATVKTSTLPSYIASYDGPLRLGRWAIIRKGDGGLIGFAGLGPQTLDECEEIEIGYRLARQEWGRGYATEAVVALRDYAFDVKRLPRLIAIIDPSNMRSQRVAEKIGMRYERDAPFYGRSIRVYAMTSHERRTTIAADEE